MHVMRQSPGIQNPIRFGVSKPNFLLQVAESFKQWLSEKNIPVDELDFTVPPQGMPLIIISTTEPSLQQRVLTALKQKEGAIEMPQSNEVNFKAARVRVVVNLPDYH